VTFYLGAHHPAWLAQAGVPLFVSRRRLEDRKTLPRAVAPWALDSGGFTELAMHGMWTVTPRDYVARVRLYADEIGSLDFAAPQDWMCEPVMLAKTGLTVADHQQRTLDNYLELRALAPDLPFIPVLQGWAVYDYWRHVEQYAEAGVDLATLPRVGVGTVCRRQNTTVASLIFHSLAAEGLRLHGFGVKLTGLRDAGTCLVSADSMAWSFHATKEPPMPGHSHKRCNNCLEFALDWRSRVPGVAQQRNEVGRDLGARS
jgi:hypothetical protein